MSEQARPVNTNNLNGRVRVVGQAIAKFTIAIEAKAGYATIKLHTTGKQFPQRDSWCRTGLNRSDSNASLGARHADPERRQCNSERCEEANGVSVEVEGSVFHLCSLLTCSGHCYGRSDG